MSRYLLKTTEQGKTNIFYYDLSESHRKRLKVLPNTTLISDLPQICLKYCDVDFSNINIYANDELIDDTDVQISVISGKIVRFELKLQNFVEMQSKYENQNVDILILQKINSKLQMDNKNLNEENSKLQMDIKNLNEKNSKLQMDIKNLTEEISNISKQYPSQ